jgi:hypothetical protein
MDSVAAVDPLRRIGEEVGNRKVLPGHFDGFL